MSGPSIQFSVFDSSIDEERSKKSYKVIDLTNYSQWSEKWLDLSKKSSKHGNLVYYALTEQIEKKYPLISKQISETLKKQLIIVNSCTLSFPYGIEFFDTTIEGQLRPKGYKIEDRDFLLKNDTKRYNLPEKREPYSREYFLRNTHFGNYHRTLREQYRFPFINISNFSAYDDARRSYHPTVKQLLEDSINQIFGPNSKVKFVSQAVGNEPDTIFRSMVHDHRLTSVNSHDGDPIFSPMTFVSETYYTGLRDKKGDLAGTSFASPRVGGIGLWVNMVHPNLDWRDYQEIFANSASLTKRNQFTHYKTDSSADLDEFSEVIISINNSNDLNGGGRPHSPHFGFGFIDPTAVLLYAYSYQPRVKKPNTIRLSLKLNSDETSPEKATADLNVDNDINLEAVNISVNCENQIVEDVDVSLINKRNKFIVLKASTKIYDRYDTESKLNFVPGTVAVRGQSSKGKWSIEFKGKKGTDWKNAKAEIIMKGRAFFSAQDYSYTNDFGGKTLREIDQKKYKKNYQRFTFNVKSNLKRARLNLAAIYSEKNSPSTYVIANLNKGEKSLINGKLVSYAENSKEFDDVYGPSVPSWLIGNNDNNVIEGGPDSNLMEGGQGSDRFDLRRYKWVEKANQDFIVAQSDDIIYFKDCLLKDVLISVDKEKNQIYGVFTKYNPKTKTLTIFYKDSFCIQLSEHSNPDLLIFRDKDNDTGSMSYVGRNYENVRINRDKSFSSHPILGDEFNKMVDSILIDKGLLNSHRPTFTLDEAELKRTFKAQFQKALNDQHNQIHYPEFTLSSLKENKFHINIVLTKEARIWKWNINEIISKINQHQNKKIISPKAITEIKITALNLKAEFTYLDLKERVNHNLKEGQSYVIKDKNELSNIGNSVLFFSKNIKDTKDKERAHEVRVDIKSGEKAKTFFITSSIVKTTKPKPFDYKEFLNKNKTDYKTPAKVILPRFSSKHIKDNFYHIHLSLDEKLGLYSIIMDWDVQKLFSNFNKAHNTNPIGLDGISSIKIKALDLKTGFTYNELKKQSMRFSKGEEIELKDFENLSSKKLIFARKAKSNSDHARVHEILIEVTSNGIKRKLLLTTSIGKTTVAKSFDFNSFSKRHNLSLSKNSRLNPDQAEPKKITPPILKKENASPYFSVEKGMLKKDGSGFVVTYNLRQKSTPFVKSFDNIIIIKEVPNRSFVIEQLDKAKNTVFKFDFKKQSALKHLSFTGPSLSPSDSKDNYIDLSRTDYRLSVFDKGKSIYKTTLSIVTY